MILMYMMWRRCGHLTRLVRTELSRGVIFTINESGSEYK